MKTIEEVIKGLECCILRDPDDKMRCSECPYNEHDTYCLNRLKMDALALFKAQEPIEARLHLCESCAKECPECDATVDGIEFGGGVGNDNIVGCTAYVNRWTSRPTDEQREATLWQS